jgi:hypothetical protein
MLVSTGQKQMHGTNSPIRIDFGPQYRGSMTGVIEAIIGAVASAGGINGTLASVVGINGTLASVVGIAEAIIGAVASIAPSPRRAGA